MSKISELSDGGCLLPTDFLIAVRSGGNVKVQADQTEFDRIRLGDNEKIELGNSQDLSIYWDGSVGKITNNIDVTGTATVDGILNSLASEFYASHGALVTTGSTAKVYATGSSFDGVNGSLVLQSRPTAGADVYVAAGATPKVVAKFFDGGDVHFFEDLGVTPKLFWDASAESLGIGGSPIAALDVKGTDAVGSLTSLADTVTRAAVFIRGSNHGNGYGLSIGYGNSTTDAQYIQSTRENGSSSFPLLLNPYGGNVGINTDSPDSPLEIQAATNSSSDTTYLKLYNAGENVGNIDFENGNGSLARITGTKAGAGASANDGILTFSTAFDSSLAERLHIDSAGLDVSGNVTARTDTAGSPTRLSVSNGGTVQAGTAARLSFYEGETETSYIERRRDGSGITAFVTPADDNPIVFESAGSLGEFARFKSGNLLVGKTAASSATVGFQAGQDGFVAVTRASAQPLVLNRTTSDGTILDLRKDGTTVASFGSLSGTQLIIDSGGDRSGIRLEDNALLPRKNSAMADGTVGLGSATYRFKDLYLSAGVYLGGTAAANKISSYEEGSWTPVAASGTINGTSISYVGKYTKVGDIVTVFIKASSASADIEVPSYVGFSGLPFTAVYDGTSTVTTEDIDVFARQGFANTSGSVLFFSASGSATGTGALECSITYKV